jgi:hypothetical protein
MGIISARRECPMYFPPELKELADALARRREDGSPDLAFAFLKFLLAEGIVTEGFRDGKPGIAITFKGKQVAANKADIDALCVRFAQQYERVGSR